LDLAKSSEKRVKLDPARLIDISEAITKTDIRELIREGMITVVQKKGVSRARANKTQIQKRKGLRKGKGSRKGTQNSRISKKKRWTNKVRSQRKLIKELKEKSIIDGKHYRKLYLLVKGGFFRSRRHIKIFIEERGMVKK